jgi:5-methylcytosine-specific restriction endonuclease McrA
MARQQDEWVRNASRRRACSAIVLAPDDQGNPPHCWICKQPGADAVDHVLPRSKYPDLIWELGNMMPAHGDCNASKGANAPTRDMGSSSRRW